MIRLPIAEERWAEVAQALRLPILEPTHRALAGLSGRPALRAKRLAALAAVDPCLGLEFLRAANQRVATLRDSPALADGVETVSHGVTLLGVENAVSLGLSLPTVEPTREAGPLGLLEAIATAHVAGHVAESWAARSGRKAPESLRLSAQTYLLADLAIWACAGDAAEPLSAARGTSEPARESAETRALGATRARIGAAIASAWQLPFVARNVFEVAPDGVDRMSGSLLAARIALATRDGWHHEEAVALLETLAARSNVDVHEAASIARRDVASAARDFVDPRLVPSARRLVLLPEESVDPDWLFVAPAPEPEAPRARAAEAPAAAPAEPRASTPPRPGDALKACREALEACARGQLAINRAMQIVVEGMRQGLRLDRVVLALVSADRKVLLGRFSSEDGDSDFLQRFRMDLTEENLFALLMRRKQALDVNADNRSAVWSKLPENARPLLSEDGFYAMSLFVGDRPVGLFYADWHAGAEEHSSEIYDQFKRLCSRTGRALEKCAA